MEVFCILHVKFKSISRQKLKSILLPRLLQFRKDSVQPFTKSWARALANNLEFLFDQHFHYLFHSFMVLNSTIHYCELILCYIIHHSIFYSSKIINLVHLRFFLANLRIQVAKFSNHHSSSSSFWYVTYRTDDFSPRMSDWKLEFWWIFRKWKQGNTQRTKKRLEQVTRSCL